MSNVLLYYVLPVGVEIAFFFAGLFAFTVGMRDGNAPARAPRKRAPELGALVMLVAGSLALAEVFTSPTPWARLRLFDGVMHTPPEQVQRFVIRAAELHQHCPLTRAAAITIDDPAAIRRITEHLNAGEAIAPNHPRCRWTANVEMVTRDATYYFSVNAPDAGDTNGTLVNVWYRPEGMGWNLGDFRVDGLDALLEEAVQHPTTRSSE